MKYACCKHCLHIHIFMREHAGGHDDSCEACRMIPFTDKGKSDYEAVR